MGAAPALFARHEHLARLESLPYWIAGADRDDVIQEARIGLWEAARCYDRELGPFPPFAKLVIRLRLLDAIKRANAKRHRPLTGRAHQTVTVDGDQLTLVDAAASPESVEGRVLERERLRLVVETIAGLSALERRAIVRAINGHGCVDKTLDNALQRARRKLRAAA